MRYSPHQDHRPLRLKVQHHRGCAAVPVTARGRIAERGSNVPVLFDGVLVRSGDLVLADGSGVGDDDGVVVVARHRLAEVADLASEIAASEDAILAAILDGATIADARKQHGYHTLQRKDK